MSAANYKPSLSLVLAHEGGFVHHKLDPGGATNKGVTQKVYDSYRAVKGLKSQTVRLISNIEVEEIYRTNYWRLVRGDNLPAGVDYCVFDFAVNSGVSRSVRYLQRVVGVNDDAIIGDMTLEAVYNMARKNEEGLIATLCANRLIFLKSLNTFPTFGKGWTRRVIGLQAGVQREDSGVIDYAIKMARADPIYSMPAAVGSLIGELPSKAVAPLLSNWPSARPTDVKGLKALIGSLNIDLERLLKAIP